MSNKNRDKGMVGVGLELGRQGLRVNRSPITCQPHGLWIQGLSMQWGGSTQPPTNARLRPG